MRGNLRTLRTRSLKGLGMQTTGVLTERVVVDKVSHPHSVNTILSVFAAKRNELHSEFDVA
jgi:hypothetical protein